MSGTENRYLAIATASAAIAIFCCAFNLTLAKRSRPAGYPASERMTPEGKTLIAAAEAHPDPMISGPFAAKLRSGEITISITRMEHALATMALAGGRYELTFDPRWLRSDAMADDPDRVLVILSHEHAHYRYFEDISNGVIHDRPLSSATCSDRVFMEVEAHAKACRDGRRYGLSSPQLVEECAHTTVTVAAYVIRRYGGREPECVPVWEYYLGTQPASRPPVKKTRKRPAPNGRASDGPIYLAPP